MLPQKSPKYKSWLMKKKKKNKVKKGKKRGIQKVVEKNEGE
jgi:hypothetical protein